MMRTARTACAKVPADGAILFTTRFFRLFSYGVLSVGIWPFLRARDFSEMQIGILWTFTLLGDLVITFILTTRADYWGRRKTLIVGGVLKIFAGVMFSFVDNIYLLVLAGIIGVITPTGGEIGPFLAVEQAALTELISDKDAITLIFAWYNFLGYLAIALGALSSGALIKALLDRGYDDLTAYQAPLIAYSIFGLIKTVLYMALSVRVEHLPAAQAQSDSSTPAPVLPSKPSWFGKFGLRRHDSKVIVAKLSALFTLDAFAGGFVMQTMIVHWFDEKYQMDPDVLGAMMMGANVFAGLSALAASPMVKKFGAINTMVFTHLPSNVLLLLVPLMPNLQSAVVMLLLRFCISQMDVPARQAYVAVVVAADERSAAGGITNIVRSVGLTVSPLLVGAMLKQPVDSISFSLPFIISGALKIVYDLALYYLFKVSSGSQADPTVQTHTAKAASDEADDTDPRASGTLPPKSAAKQREHELEQLLGPSDDDLRREQAHADLARQMSEDHHDEDDGTGLGSAPDDFDHDEIEDRLTK